MTDSQSRRGAGGLEFPIAPAAPEEPVSLAPGIWRIELPVPFPPGTVGVLALEDHFEGRDCWTVIDTGMRSAEPAWRRLIEGALSHRPIGRVIATHHHPDHIGLAGWMRREFGAPLWTTRTAWLYARMLQLDNPAEPPAEAVTFYERSGYGAEQMARWRKRVKSNFSVTVAPLPLGFQQIAEGDAIAIGDRSWRVMVGHGHAPEHACLLSEADGIFIAGDQVLPRITPNIGVYPTEPDADPLGDWLASCRDFERRLDDAVLVAPGHGAPFRGASKRLGQVIERHQAALDRLSEHLAEPRSVVECFPALYARAIDGSLEGLATAEGWSNLNHLTATGRAERWLDADGVYRWRRL